MSINQKSVYAKGWNLKTSSKSVISSSPHFHCSSHWLYVIALYTKIPAVSKKDSRTDLIQFSITFWWMTRFLQLFYILYLKPKWPLFDWKGPCFGGLTFKNRGQLGSRYIIHIKMMLLLCMQTNGNYKIYTPELTNMTIAGKSAIFNRKYTFIHGGFSSQSC